MSDKHEEVLDDRQTRDLDATDLDHSPEAEKAGAPAAERPVRKRHSNDSEMSERPRRT